jgi:DNA-binding SARP family transcriptional activator
MLYLQTFGVVDLRGTTRLQIRPLLAQPKRMALLVFLALAGKGVFRRRDTLVSLFWPEQDEPHARSALRQAVRFLRVELGSAAIIGRGEEEIGVDSGVLQCDVVEFEAACAAREWEAALELYRGDLLAGWFLADASAEFESWLEDQRSRLRRLASQAAWARVEAAERLGDPVAAAPLARRAVELFPYDEAGLRRLMRILDRRGDRAGALHAYQSFRSRLHAEYGVGPSPETEAVVTAIRSRAEPIWESPLRGWPPESPKPAPP